MQSKRQKRCHPVYYQFANGLMVTPHDVRDIFPYIYTNIRVYLYVHVYLYIIYIHIYIHGCHQVHQLLYSHYSNKPYIVLRGK